MNCDKCGKPVHPKDDSVLMEHHITGNDFILAVGGARHIKCSPSRAQYVIVDGKPLAVDNRPEYDKLNRDAGLVYEQECLWTSAYKFIQNKYGGE